MILDDSWVSSREFLDTDSSEEEEKDEVLPITNVSNVSSTTGTLNSPGNNVDMYHTATVENFKTIERNLVASVRDNSDTNFSVSKKNTNIVDIDYVTYAIQDVENIDNIDFNDTDNSLLDSDEEVKEWEY